MNCMMLIVVALAALLGLASAFSPSSVRKFSSSLRMEADGVLNKYR